MQREYVVSDDGVVFVEELEDWVAVRGVFQPAWGTAVALRDVARIGHEEIAYSQAQWGLARRDGDAFESLRLGRVPAGADGVGRVYRYRERIFIGKQQLAVQLEDGMSPDQARTWLEDRGHPVDRVSEVDDNLLVVNTGARDPFELAAELRTVGPPVEFTEPLLLEVLEGRTAPDDPYFPYQENLARIEVPAAWNVTRGFRSKIAVVDFGFDPDHEEFEGAIGDDSCTRGGSGLWSWGISGTSCPDHGTVCASVAGARGWNGVGLVGVAPKSRLQLVAIGEVASSCHVTDTDAIAEAFVRAAKGRPPRVKRGADVISCSVGSGKSIVTPILRNALRYCGIKGRNGLGVPIFWAVANGSGYTTDDDEIARHRRVIGVGALDKSDLAGGHATGKGLELLAPGEDIAAANAGGGYASAAGTSVATPTVAAVAALVIAANDKLSARQVRLILRFTAEKVGPMAYLGPWGWNDTYGYGLVNAKKAVRLARWLKINGIPV